VLVSVQGADYDNAVLGWRRLPLVVNGSKEVEAWRLVISATVGTPGHGDIAIDDISFTPHCMQDDSPTPTPKYV
jgi:hypothetical protein